MSKTWRRILDDDVLGKVEQYITVDEYTGEMFGYEKYENGKVSEPQPVGRTLPLGYELVDE